VLKTGTFPHSLPEQNIAAPILAVCSCRRAPTTNRTAPPIPTNWKPFLVRSFTHLLQICMYSGGGLYIYISLPKSKSIRKRNRTSRQENTAVRMQQLKERCGIR